MACIAVYVSESITVDVDETIDINLDLSDYGITSKITIEDGDVSGSVRAEYQLDTTVDWDIDEDIEVDIDEDQIIECLEQEDTDLGFLYDWMQDGELHNDFIDHITKNELSAEDTDTLIVKLTRYKQELEFKKAQEELAGGDDDSAQA